MQHRTHAEHEHVHGHGCGHVGVRHDGHVDFLHDGHLHHMHGDHVDEHEVAASATNPNTCSAHVCDGHEPEHVHGPSCGHPAVPHAGHVDYLVGGHLHHPCEKGHCDHHGDVALS